MTTSKTKLQIARWLEQRLPPSLLAAAAWPYISLLALRRAFGQHGRHWRTALSTMRAGRPGLFATCRHLMDESYMMLATSWPDRLLEPRWQRRMAVSGFTAVRELYEARTPIVLAVVHFTHMSMLRFMLRSHGIPAASLAGFRNPHPTIDIRNAALDRTVGLTGVPNSFVAADLRSAYDFLRSGNCLIIACDVASPASIAMRTDLGTLHMATGPFRLAAMTGATVIPAILWQARRWRFSVDFGKPIAMPADFSMPEDFRPAAQRCMDHWLPVMRRYPTQYDGALGPVWQDDASAGFTAPITE